MINTWGYFIAIGAHLLNGSVSIIDKFLLTKTFKNPAAYAFWIGILSLGTFILLPFGFTLPTGWQWLIDFSAGATFILALYFFYLAIQAEEVTRIVPIVGSLIPIFTLLLSYFWLGERLIFPQILAIGIIILGIVLLTYRKSSQPINYQILLAGPLAALLFAGSAVLMKEVFASQPFIGGLVWSRLGGVIVALLFLIFPKNRPAIWEKEAWPQGGKLILFLAGRLFSTAGFILVNLAISLISVTVVNALQGIQYAFLFILTLLLTKFWPQIIRESLGRLTLVYKFLGIIIIILGSLLLAL